MKIKKHRISAILEFMVVLCSLLSVYSIAYLVLAFYIYGEVLFLLTYEIVVFIVFIISSLIIVPCIYGIKVIGRTIKN
ncbi:hypothetical protein SP99_04584 [Enterobacter sp. BIDMC92]|nr:hypothetical protein SP99_04584 [Enterobacter sp. BIDMC92]